MLVLKSMAAIGKPMVWPVLSSVERGCPAATMRMERCFATTSPSSAQAAVGLAPDSDKKTVGEKLKVSRTYQCEREREKQKERR